MQSNHLDIFKIIKRSARTDVPASKILPVTYTRHVPPQSTINYPLYSHLPSYRSHHGHHASPARHQHHPQIRDAQNPSRLSSFLLHASITNAHSPPPSKHSSHPVKGNVYTSDYFWSVRQGSDNSSVSARANPLKPAERDPKGRPPHRKIKKETKSDRFSDRRLFEGIT